LLFEFSRAFFCLAHHQVRFELIQQQECRVKLICRHAVDAIGVKTFHDLHVLRFGPDGLGLGLGVTNAIDIPLDLLEEHTLQLHDLGLGRFCALLEPRDLGLQLGDLLLGASVTNGLESSDVAPLAFRIGVVSHRGFAPVSNGTPGATAYDGAELAVSLSGELLLFLLPRLLPGEPAECELLERCGAGDIVRGRPLLDHREELAGQAKANGRANAAVIL